MNKLLLVFLIIYSNLAFPKSIELWHTLSLQDAEIVKKAVSRIESKYSVQINMSTVFEIQTNLIKAAYFKVLPDIVIGPGDLIGLWKIANFSAISDEITNKVKVESPDLQRNYLINDRHFGVPLMGGNFLMLYYNKKYVSKPISNFEDLLHLQLPSNVRPITWDISEPFYIIPFLEAFNVRFFEKENDLLHADVFTKALTQYKKTILQLGLDTNCYYKCVVDSFIKGEFAYMINGDWLLNDIEQRLGDNWGAIQLPLMNNNKMNSTHFGTGIFFPNNSFKINNAAFNDLLSELHNVSIQNKLGLRKHLPVNSIARKNFMNIIPPQARPAFTKTRPIKVVNQLTRMTYLWPTLTKTINMYLGTDIHLRIIVQRNEQLLNILTQKETSGEMLQSF